MFNFYQVLTYLQQTHDGRDGEKTLMKLKETLIKSQTTAISARKIYNGESI